MTTMTTRPLGRTGLQVSPLVLGAMMLGGRGNPDRADCIRIIHRALDAGVNTIDTADLYGQGESERIVGEALAGGRRDDVVLATKFHGPMGDDPNRRGTSRRWVMQAVEDSLKRLGTDWIDLYQVHRPEPGTDFDETLGALSDLMHQGKIRAIGTSTFSAAEIVEGQWIADRRGRERVVCEQPPYSILARGIEAEVLPACARYGLGVLTWSPLSAGWLSGAWRRDGGPAASSRAAHFPQRYDLAVPHNQAKLEAAEQLAQLADDAGLSLIHLALGFVLEHPAVSAAIIGPRTQQHLESQLGAADVRLGADVLDRIDAIVAPGTTLNEADLGVSTPELDDPARRRRPRWG
jgi:aryl-alcohol dehydrogenase-like predicted oxidoreductase